MNQFFQRVAHYVTNELIVKSLADSKTFQRFAVRTEAQMQKLSQYNKLFIAGRKSKPSEVSNMMRRVLKNIFSLLNKVGK